MYPTEKFCEISGILIANVTMLKKAFNRIQWSSAENWKYTGCS